MENHFKKKLQNHKVDWDKEELLGDLQTALSQKETPSKKLKFLLLLVPILGFVLYWPIKMSKDNPTSNSVQLTNEKGEILNQQDERLTSQEVLKESDDTFIQESISASAENENLNNNASGKKQNVRARYEVKNDLVIPQEFKPQFKKYEDDSPINPRNNSNSKNLNGIQNVPERFSVNNENTSTRLNSNQNLRKRKSNELLAKNEIKNLQETVSLNQAEEVNLIEFIPLHRMKSILILNDTKPDLQFTEASVSGAKDENEEIQKVKIYFEPNISAGLLQPRFRSLLNGPDDYLNRKMETERGIIHDAASIEIGALIKDKWTIQVGLEYQEMREKFTYDFPLETDTIVMEFDKAFYTYNESTVDTIFYAGLRPVITNELRKVRHYNKHTYLSIPVNVGRNFTINNSTIHASFGVTYALSHNFEGRTLRRLNIISENESFYFKNRMGFQFGLGLNHSLSTNKDLFLKASFRQSPSLSFGEVYEKYHLSYSLDAGVRFYLGRNK